MGLLCEMKWDQNGMDEKGFSDVKQLLSATVTCGSLRREGRTHNPLFPSSNSGSTLLHLL
jgi:hypothetical protein